MKAVFADTVYWIALTNPHDQHHEVACKVSATHGRGRIVTSEAVLTEYLNALPEKGPSVRKAAILSVEAILSDPLVTVLPLSRRSFQKGFAFYKTRPDKGYSLTDCLSMTMMRERKLRMVLTSDRHFANKRALPL
ncbi:MAG: PIN domain-containing protein [Nitrospiraceae bacterium]